MIIQFAILFICLGIGEFIVWLTEIPIPSSIIGMLCLTALLKFGVIKLSRIEALSNFLTRNLGFFFVPAGIGLMQTLGLVVSELAAIVCACVGSTVLIMITTGLIHQEYRRWFLNRSHRKSLKSSNRE